MKSFRKVLFSLATAASVIPAIVQAHPGHTHETGVLAAVNHTVIGWDQLIVLFAVAAVALYAFRRISK